MAGKAGSVGVWDGLISGSASELGHGIQRLVVPVFYVDVCMYLILDDFMLGHDMRGTE